MSKVPSLAYDEIVRALRRDGWVVVRQKGRDERTLKITLPAHRPVKRSTLSHILKHAEIDISRFLDLL